MPAKNINLLVRADFDVTTIGRFLRWSLTYGRYIIICTEIIVLLAFIYRFSLDRKITDLNDEIEQKSAIILANQEFEQQFRNLQFRTRQITQLVGVQNTALTILHHLEQISPAGIVFSSFSLLDNQVQIQATVDTNSTLAQFLAQLKNSDFLTDVSISNLSKKITNNGRTSFQLVATVRDQSQNQVLP